MKTINAIFQMSIYSVNNNNVLKEFVLFYFFWFNKNTFSTTYFLGP